MTREMTERYMTMLDEFHSKNVFVQPDGSTICRGCKKGWPCDERQLLDVFKDQGRLLDIISALNMQAYGLISELVEAVESREDYEVGIGGDIVARCKEYLAIGMPS